MRTKAILPLLLASIMLLPGCNKISREAAGFSDGDTSNVDEIVATAQVNTNSSGMFTDRDMEIGYDEESSAKIVLSGDSASSDFS